MSTHDMVLTRTRAEARVDTRLLAAQLGIKHKSLLESVARYENEIRSFGIVPFKTEKLSAASPGRPERFALLNENQAVFLLSLSRNSRRVVELKIRLVQAFQEARCAAELRKTEYLPAYHGLHNAVHNLAAGSPRERFVHLNVNRLVNQVAGVDPGARPDAPVPQQAMLIVAQTLAARALEGAADHHDGFQRVKTALEPLRLGGAK